VRRGGYGPGDPLRSYGPDVNGPSGPEFHRDGALSANSMKSLGRPPSAALPTLDFRGGLGARGGVLPCWRIGKLEGTLEASLRTRAAPIQPRSRLPAGGLRRS